MGDQPAPRSLRNTFENPKNELDRLAIGELVFLEEMGVIKHELSDRERPMVYTSSVSRKCLAASCQFDWSVSSHDIKRDNQSDVQMSWTDRRFAKLRYGNFHE
ncbi:hypothetical protein PMI41_04460 [Phyllobacterium sp. YR531]|nr:hypothetical protein PMI41_04460 [Phyllobacterium sp. YR531]